MTITNPLLASLQARPILVAEDSAATLESFLNQAIQTQTQIDTRMSTEDMQMKDDYWPDPESWLAAYRPYQVSDSGLLTIPVRGVLLNAFTYASPWATGYQYVRRAFDRGIADPQVKGIAMVYDSPGGDVRGCFDLTDHMYENRGEKPVRAYANEHAFSAAYALASAADEITLPRTGGVGSIGVMTMHIDQSQMLENMGLKITLVQFGKYKTEGHSSQPLSEEALGRIQERINATGEIFVAAVARNRGIKPKAVRATEALCYGADEATSNGLADTVGSIDDEIAAFAAELSKEDYQMTKKTGTDAANTSPTGEEDSQVQYDTGFAAGVVQGAADQLTRINAILGCDEAKTRPSAAMAAALETDMSADRASAFLGKLPDEASTVTNTDDQASGDAPKGAGDHAQDFQAHMDGANHPQLGQQSDDKPKLSRAKAAAASTGRTAPTT